MNDIRFKSGDFSVPEYIFSLDFKLIPDGSDMLLPHNKKDDIFQFDKNHEAARMSGAGILMAYPCSVPHQYFFTHSATASP
jgi:hypothetical protein